MTCSCRAAFSLNAVCRSSSPSGVSVLKNPGEFGVLGHLRLHEYGRDSGIQSRREQSHGHLPGTPLELVTRVRHRDRVIVHHAEKRLVGVLQGHPVLHGAEVVSYVEITRRLNAAEDAGHCAKLKSEREELQAIPETDISDAELLDVALEAARGDSGGREKTTIQIGRASCRERV